MKPMDLTDALTQDRDRRRWRRYSLSFRLAGEPWTATATVLCAEGHLDAVRQVELGQRARVADASVSPFDRELQI